MQYLKPVFINAFSLSDAWFQTIFKCVDVGKTFTIDKGSFEGQKRLEFDHLTVHIKRPWETPLLPKVNPQLGFPDPVKEGYLDDYLPYLMTGEEKKGEAYTYGQRIVKERFKSENHDLYIENYKDHINFLPNFGYFLDQMELLIWTYKNRGYRNNQMILQVGKPTDMLLVDPPCLRHIDTRIQNDTLYFFPYFRSWDLFGGFPANLAAIEMMKQYIAKKIGVQNGGMIVSSKGAHIYDYVFEIAEAIRGKSIGEFLEENLEDSPSSFELPS